MAGRKFADVPKCSNFSSSQSPGWDQEEARKLVEESAYLNPRPTLIFVRPAPNLMPTVSYRDRENGSLASSAPPQRRMGRIKITEEEYKQFVGTELSRRRRK